MTDVRHCCFIGCKRAATWEIWWLHSGIRDNIESCSTHLGELLPTETHFTGRIIDVSAVDQLGKLVDG